MNNKSENKLILQSITWKGLFILFVAFFILHSWDFAGNIRDAIDNERFSNRPFQVIKEGNIFYVFTSSGNVKTCSIKEEAPLKNDPNIPDNNPAKNLKTSSFDCASTGNFLIPNQEP